MYRMRQKIHSQRRGGVHLSGKRQAANSSGLSLPMQQLTKSRSNRQAKGLCSALLKNLMPILTGNTCELLHKHLLVVLNFLKRCIWNFVDMCKKPMRIINIQVHALTLFKIINMIKATIYMTHS